MLRIFRSNQIFVAIVLFVYLVVIRSGAILGWIEAPEGANTGGLLYQSWFGWMKDAPVFSAITALILVFLQSFIVNFLADDFRLLGDRNWFPGLFYGICASAFPDYLFVSAPLVAATFIPIGLYKIFQAFQKPNVHAAILDSGIWLSVGCLFYPPLIWLVPAGFAGLLIVRVFRSNEMFIYVAGALIPIFWGWLWYFWADKGASFRDLQLGSLRLVNGFNVAWTDGDLARLSMLVVFILLFLLGLPAVLNKKGIQIQKYVSVLFWFLVAGIFSIFFQEQWHWANWFVTIAPLAVFLSLGYQETFKKWWIEMAHLILLLFIFAIQYLKIWLPYVQYL
ncbi:MAG: hypothetical protein JNN28_17360 [Saprospiraceae bacterium]|nr:hypothetical protein [Saprospiraceae bacterium]